MFLLKLKLKYTLEKVTHNYANKYCTNDLVSKHQL